MKPTSLDQPALHGFETRLLKQLRAVVAENRPEDLLSPEPGQAPRPRRRGRRRLLAGAAVALALGLAVVPTLLPDAKLGDRAFAVKRLDSGIYTVSFANGNYVDADKVIAALRELGVGVEVTTAPVSPGMVGSIVMFEVQDGTPGVRLDPADGHALQIDPEQLRSTIRIVVGIATPPGVNYRHGQTPFYPGEVLAGLQCVLGPRMQATELARYADRAGVRFRWTILTPSPDGGGSTRPVDQGDPVPRGLVVYAHAPNARVVEVGVLPAGRPETDDFRARDVAPPCDVTQAARWR